MKNLRWLQKILNLFRPKAKSGLFFMQRDDELLGYLSDKHKQQIEIILSYLSKIDTKPESMLSRASTDANKAMLLNHIYQLHQATSSTLIKLLSNKQEYLSKTNEIEISPDFKIPNASRRCGKSIVLLNELKMNIRSVPPLPYPQEDLSLWDNPLDASIKSLPTYVSFRALCQLLLEEKLTDEIIDSIAILEENRVRINGRWMEISKAEDELKKRLRLFNGKIAEIQGEFFANIYPDFLYLLSYESILFTTLNFFVLEAILKDMRSFLDWYIPKESDYFTPKFRTQLEKIRTTAISINAEFFNLLDEFHRLIQSRADVYQISKKQVDLANRLIRLDADLGRADQSLGTLSKKVWRLNVREGASILLEYVPYAQLFDRITNRTIHPQLKTAFEEVEEHLENNKMLELSGKLSSALLHLYQDCSVDLKLAQLEEPARLPALYLPQQNQLSREVSQKISKTDLNIGVDSYGEQ